MKINYDKKATTKNMVESKKIVKKKIKKSWQIFKSSV